MADANNMKRVELKRIVEFLWKGSPAEEKTPFASQGSLPDNGSFSKTLDSDDDKAASERPMSILRKMCFAMSFNLWILYFLVFGWLLPCRHHDCGPYPDTMQRILGNIRPLTDVEPMNGKGLPSLAMLGYSEGREIKLAALATFDATFEWNNSLPFIPEKIQCNFENMFDANKDGIPDCLVSGFEDVYAFNASNGYVLWHHRLPSLEGQILSGFHPTAAEYGEVHLIGAYGDKVAVLSAETGNKTLEIDLPCSSPIDVRILANSVEPNSTIWSLVCNYGDKMEAWSFEERDVLRRGNSENDSAAFKLLYSGTNSGRSIDLRRDVTALPGGPLFLSFADHVAMVTRETIAWKQYMPSFFPPSAGIAVGNFSLIDTHVAVALRNGSETVVALIRTKDGIFDEYITLANRQAQAVEKVPGEEDWLLVKSVILGNSTRQLDDFSDLTSSAQTNFALVDFPLLSNKIKEVANVTSVLYSSVNVQTNGETDLLVLKSENGTTVYVRYHLRDSEVQNSMCHSLIEM